MIAIDEIAALLHRAAAELRTELASQIDAYRIRGQTDEEVLATQDAGVDTESYEQMRRWRALINEIERLDREREEGWLP